MRNKRNPINEISCIYIENIGNILSTFAPQKHIDPDDYTYNIADLFHILMN